VHSDVGEILTRTNRVLAADTSEFHFVTLSMARLDPTARNMIYASAGQRGYLLHPGLDVAILDSTSLPLGVHDDTVVPASGPIPLASGDLVTFFTDGVVEAESPGRVRFGVSRALEVIRSEREKSPAEIIDALHKHILGFSRKMPQADDITVVVVKVL
jgi:sigma-B regulation protein RsbU (phosphoserine phosphatase)